MCVRLVLVKKILLVCIFTFLSQKSVLAASPTVSFSQDLKTVAIDYDTHHYVIPRPIIPPTIFTPTNGRQPIYVDKNGSGSYIKIQDAINAAIPGDVIYVKAGTYEEGGLQVHNKTGTAARPFILSAAPEDIGKVIMRHANISLSHVLSFENRSDYWTVNGFVIEGIMRFDSCNSVSCYTDESVGLMWNNSVHGRATNNVVYYNPHSGIKSGDRWGLNNVIDAYSYHEVVGNIIFANGYDSRNHGLYANGAYGTISGNIAFNNPGYGLHLYAETSHHNLVTSNVAFGNDTGGIVTTGTSNKIYNNTFVSNGAPNSYSVGGVLIYTPDCVSNDIQNNIASNNWDNNYYTDHASNQGNTFDYNLVWGDSLGYQSWYGDPDSRIPPLAHNFRADPLFVNPSIGDFHLQANSSAKNAGSDGKDLGAYQSGGMPTIINIVNFRQLLTNFTNIFAFNTLVASYGK